MNSPHHPVTFFILVPAIGICTFALSTLHLSLLYDSYALYDILHLLYVLLLPFSTTLCFKFISMPEVYFLVSEQNLNPENLQLV